jgi:hypothetical protein
MNPGAITTIVVGGHSRKVGKTSVVAGLIAAFSQYPWTAAKISTHRHMNSLDSNVDANEDFLIQEESDRIGDTDTSRYIAAGAVRSLWIRINERRFEAGMQRLLPILRSNPYLIVESNSILRFIQPDLTIMVLRPNVEEFKESAREMLSRADAVVAVDYHPSSLLLQTLSHEALARIPFFATPDVQIIPKGLVDFVRARLNL